MNQDSGFQVRGSAPDFYEEFNRPIMTPFVATLLEKATVIAGNAVLDVACGTGFAARRAAEIVGPAGRVAGVDVNPGMIAKARTIPSVAGAAISWHEGSALDLPFATGEFDRVVSQQAIQFFPDVPKAVSEMARVLGQGRVAVSFWSPLEDQTFMAAQVYSLIDVLGNPARPLAAAFELDPIAVEEEFRRSGLENVTSEKVVAVITLPDFEDWASNQVMSLPVAGAFLALPAEAKRAWVSELAQALTECCGDDGKYRCAFSSWFVCGDR